ncbi:MAG TPA: exopolysaccharide biosynthesis polyprenyl glycosylphosphotransferase [Candidatus Paceibacterota bacterium]|nr:exopolysaccharide biosynthesis polyprenyl glycosylphosphotransferase [Candidatus Paceibacterota bacterium]
MNRAGLIIFGDFIAFLISFLLLVSLFFKGQDTSSVINSHAIPFTILYLSWVLIFYVFGLYDLFSIKPTIPYLKRWIIAIVCAFAVGILFFYFIPIFGISPKINLIIQVVGFGILSFFFRRTIYMFFSKAITRPAMLIGESFYLSELEKTILRNPQIGLSVVGHLNSIDEIKMDEKNFKDLIIILDKNIKIEDKDILSLYRKGVEIIDTAKAYEKYLYKIPVEYINLSFIVEDVEIKKDIFYTITTRIIDTIFSIIALIISSPLLLISSLFIYMYDKGPIFYTQERVGINEKVFKLYKLRSMIIDSEKDGAKWSTGKNDTRITPIGRVIRKLHIDEIPQMINILKGDISLVGPRPERPEFVNILNKDIPYYSFRHVIRPGFTGWAQIKYVYANTVKDSKEKFEYDLYYIKNRNIFLDFGIILRTIQIIFTH